MRVRFAFLAAAFLVAACVPGSDGGQAASPDATLRSTLSGCVAGAGAQGPETLWLQSRGVAINHRGDILGSVGSSRGAWRPAIWRDGRLYVLGLPREFESGLGELLNDASDVLVVAWRRGGRHAGERFLWRAGRIRRLVGLPTADAEVTAMNNHAHLAGTYRDSSGFQRGFVWRDGRWNGLTELDAFTEMGGYHVVVKGLGDDGGVVGEVRTIMEDPGHQEAFLWRGGNWALPLYGSGVVQSDLRVLDERGDAFGTYARGEASAPFAWRRGGVDTTSWRRAAPHVREITAVGEGGAWVGRLATGEAFSVIGDRLNVLPAPPGFAGDNIEPRGVNRAGRVVGQAWVPEPGFADSVREARAVIWKGRTPILLPLEGTTCTALPEAEAR